MSEQIAVCIQRKQNFFQTPNVVVDYYLAKIGATAFAVHSILERHAFTAGETWLSIKTICRLTGVSRFTVWRSLKTLAEHHLVSVTDRRRQNLTNLYTLLDPPDPPAAARPSGNHVAPMQHGHVAPMQHRRRPRVEEDQESIPTSSSASKGEPEKPTTTQRARPERQKNSAKPSGAQPPAGLVLILSRWKSPSRRPNPRGFTLDSIAELYRRCPPGTSTSEILRACDEKVKLGLKCEGRGQEIGDWVSWLIATVPGALAQPTELDEARKQAAEINRRARAGEITEEELNGRETA